MKVYLGGTANGSIWREVLIPHLKIDYYNPIVNGKPNENDFYYESNKIDYCDYYLYVVTPVMQTGYTIAEAVNRSSYCNGKVIFCLLRNDTQRIEEEMLVHHFSDYEYSTYVRVGEMIEKNGGHFYTSLKDVITFLNTDAISSLAHKLYDKLRDTKFYYYDTREIEKAKETSKYCRDYLNGEITKVDFIKIISENYHIDYICNSVCDCDRDCFTCMCNYFNIQDVEETDNV